MAFNMKEYSKGKARGIEIAYTILQKHDIEELEKDIEFRLNACVDCDFTSDYIDKEIEFVKGVFFETSVIMAVNVLRDEFDFGKVRTQRFYKEYMNRANEFAKKHIRDWYFWQRDTLRRLNLKEFKVRKTGDKFRRNAYEEGRIAGMQLLLEKAKKGANAEIKDIVWQRDPRKRGDGQVDKNTERAYQRIQFLCYDTVLLLLVDVIHEMYRFGDARMDRFFRRWDLKTYCMEDRMVSWEDLIEVARAECGIEFKPFFMYERGILSK